MKGLDPITVEVITERLIAIVREMRATMVRTAYSMTVYEMKDFSCALFDGEGRLVAQSRLDLPVHVVPMPWSVRAILEDFEGDIHCGDVFLTNDVYRGGTHLNDVTMLYPVFEGERLAFLAANRSHWDDVGGMVPGSMSGLAVEVLQEGVRIPPIKVFEQGRPVKSVMDVLYANMRVPEERQGDFRAMRSTCLTAEQRIHELLARYGGDTVFAAVDRNIERTEERTREHIRALPDGTYRAEDYLEFYNAGVLDPVMLRVAIVVRGDRLDVDFTGSSAQVAGVVNASLAVSAAGVVIALKAFFDPDDPINHGIFAPITFTAPPSTVVNASPPVPCGAHAEIRRRTISLTLAALARAHPERMAGDMQGTSNHTLIGGVDDRTGRGYVFYEVPGGSWRKTDRPCPGPSTGPTTSRSCRRKPSRCTIRFRSCARRSGPIRAAAAGAAAGSGCAWSSSCSHATRRSRWSRIERWCRPTACSKAAVARRTPTGSGATVIPSRWRRRARPVGFA